MNDKELEQKIESIVNSNAYFGDEANVYKNGIEAGYRLAQSELKPVDGFDVAKEIQSLLVYSDCAFVPTISEDQKKAFIEAAINTKQSIINQFAALQAENERLKADMDNLAERAPDWASGKDMDLSPLLIILEKYQCQ